RLDTPVARAEHGNVVDPGRENRERHQCAAEPGQGDAADVLHRRELTEVARERPECHADADQRAHPDEQHDSEQRGVVHYETEGPTIPTDKTMTCCTTKNVSAGTALPTNISSGVA